MEVELKGHDYVTVAEHEMCIKCHEYLEITSSDTEYSGDIVEFKNYMCPLCGAEYRSAISLIEDVGEAYLWVEEE